jgi:hypothetical protein
MSILQQNDSAKPGGTPSAWQTVRHGAAMAGVAILIGSILAIVLLILVSLVVDGADMQDGMPLPLAVALAVALLCLGNSPVGIVVGSLAALCIRSWAMRRRLAPCLAVGLCAVLYAVSSLVLWLVLGLVNGEGMPLDLDLGLATYIIGFAVAGAWFGWRIARWLGVHSTH